MVATNYGFRMNYSSYIFLSQQLEDSLQNIMVVLTCQKAVYNCNACSFRWQIKR